MEIQEYYNKESKIYDQRRVKGYHKHTSTIKIIILKNYIKNKKNKVLEVGCGTGIILKNINNLCDASGIDLSTDMIKMAISKGLNIQKAEATQLPFKNNTFNIVYSFQVLPHVPHITKAINEIKRVCKNDGIIIFDLYNKYSPKYLNYFFKEVLFRKKTTYTKFFSLREMKDLFPKEFEILEIRPIRIFGLFGFLYKIEPLAKLFDRLDWLFRKQMQSFGSHIIFVIKNHK